MVRRNTQASRPTATVRRRRLLAAIVAGALGGPGFAGEPCSFMCGDVNGDATIDFADFDALAGCMGQPPGSSPACTCADLDGSGAIDMRDVAIFSLLFGATSDELPPDCTGAAAATANLTAYRPQHGSGYAPFARTAVSDADEAHPRRGPGIRLNAAGDIDPAGEDDLIELHVGVDPPGAQLALRRGTAALRIWTTRNRQAGTEIAFLADKTGVLPIGPGQSQLTLWVEWASPTHGASELHIESPALSAPKDTLLFHSFQSIVIALGGENQVPTDPPDPNSGTFVAAQALYRAGYDVHMFDEDGVNASGAGVVFNEAATAIRERSVGALAIFGYSHGGGSTYDLAELLDLSRPALGVFEIEYTSYVDSVSNNSDIDTAQELRRPPSTGFHLNHFQRGVFFEDLGLDGGPVPNSNPPPTGLDVETTPWGSGATHFEVDDFVQVLDLLKASLQAALAQP